MTQNIGIHFYASNKIFVNKSLLNVFKMLILKSNKEEVKPMNIIRIVVVQFNSYWYRRTLED